MFKQILGTLMGGGIGIEISTRYNQFTQVSGEDDFENEIINNRNNRNNNILAVVGCGILGGYLCRKRHLNIDKKWLSQMTHLARQKQNNIIPNIRQCHKHNKFPLVSVYNTNQTIIDKIKNSSIDNYNAHEQSLFDIQKINDHIKQQPEYKDECHKSSPSYRLSEAQSHLNNQSSLIMNLLPKINNIKGVGTSIIKILYWDYRKHKYPMLDAYRDNQSTIDSFHKARHIITTVLSDNTELDFQIRKECNAILKQLSDKTLSQLMYIKRTLESNIDLKDQLRQDNIKRIKSQVEPYKYEHFNLQNI